MAEPSTDIIARFFRRARDDARAAPLADAFRQCYDAGEWNAKSLANCVDDLVAANTEPEDGR